MSSNKAIRNAYGEAIAKLGKENKDIVVLDADVASSSKSILFGNEFPNRFFNIGIAEANMVAMAAGFAAAGKIPFVNTFAVFMILRAGDPIRNIAYSNLNVKLVGTYAGLSDSYDGASHHSIEDIAFMRALPNMTVISVADAVEAEKAVKAIANYKGPVYLRISRAEVPIIFDDSYIFKIGQGEQLKEGRDISIIATGYMVQKALIAADLLKMEGINARVVNIHTIKPIDRNLIIKCARETGGIVTAEEHNVCGGLGSAVSEVLSKEYPVHMEMIGVEDIFTESGDYEEVLEKYGLSPLNIISKVKNVLNRTK